MGKKEFSIKAPDGSVIKVTADSNAAREEILTLAKQKFGAKPEKTAEFSIKAPDGSVVKVTADAGTSREEILTLAKQQFEAKAKAEPEKPMVSGRGISGQIKTNEREAFLSDLEKTNPFQAKALRDMNPFERALIGAGSGFSTLLEGAGILSQRPEDEKLATEQIAKSGNSFGAGQLVGQAAPFAGLGMAAGAALKGAPIVNTITQGAIGAAEGGIVARGTGGDAGDILAGTITGGALGSGAEVLAPILNRAARSVVQKVTGAPPAGRLIDDAGRPTAELQRALDKSGQSFDEVVAAATSKDTGSVAKSIVSAGRSDAPEAAADAISVNPERVAAAKRIGVLDSAPVAVLTDDAAAQQLGGALAAMQGTKESVALDKLAADFGQAADSFIADIGGSIDRNAVSDELLGKITDDITRIKAIENRLYGPIDDAIGRGTRIEDYAQPLKNRLAAKARNSGGEKRLPRHEREMLQMLKSQEGMTYQNLIDKMHDIGNAAYRKTTTYDDIDTASLKMMYGDLMRVREAAADTFGVGEKMAKAKKLGASRFALQESSDALFGQNLERSIFGRIDRAVKGLPQGAVREFTVTMDLIPAKHRKSVAASMLSTAMTGGRDQSVGINSTQFSKWFRNLERQPTAMSALKKYVGETEVGRLKDFATLAEGVSGVTKNRIRTGVAGDSLKRLDDVNAVAKKLYQIAGPMAGAVSGAVRGAADLIGMAKTPAVEAADNVLSSSKFRAAVIEGAKSGVKTDKFKRLDAALKASPEYKKYMSSLTPDLRSQVAATGLIAWLATSKDEEEK
jgi:TusA-related sulfurtransferase